MYYPPLICGVLLVSNLIVLACGVKLYSEMVKWRVLDGRPGSRSRT